MVSSMNISGIGAYQNAQKTLGAGGIKNIAAGEGEASFADMLSGYAQETIGTLKKGETPSIAAAKGQADITDVVGAVQNAMRTLELVTTVRDKVITAYQDILRMPI